MSNSKTTGYQALPRNAALDILVDATNRIVLGRINVTQSNFKLRASQTTTTLTDSRIGPTSFIDFMPTTANAATAKATIWISAQTKGSCTVNHASSANADQTFTAIIIG